MQLEVAREIATASLLGWYALPLDFAWAQQPSSGSATSTLDGNTAPRRTDSQGVTADEHMERLRIGLEQLALKYPTREAHMAQLRQGLERMARNLNSSK